MGMQEPDFVVTRKSGTKRGRKQIMKVGVGKKLVISGLMLGAAALVPSIALAFSSGFDSRPVSIDARGGIGSFTPASVDPGLPTS